MIYTTVSTCIGSVTSPVLIIAVLLVFTGCKDTPTDAGGDESLQSVAGDYLVTEMNGRLVPSIVDLPGKSDDGCFLLASGGWISLMDDGKYSHSVGEEYVICDGAFSGTVRIRRGYGTYSIQGDSLFFDPEDWGWAVPFKGVMEGKYLTIDIDSNSYQLSPESTARHPYKIENYWATRSDS